MDLKQLFESNLLNDETKTVLSEAFESAVEAKRVELEESFTQQLEAVRTEMTQQNIELIEAALEDEISALAEEVAEARTLDVRYATQLNEFKEKYDEKMTEMVNVMVAEQVAEEITELKEDIEFARKHQFVNAMFESFRDAYESNFVSEDDTASVRAQLKEAQDQLASIQREKALDSVLEGLTGSKRQVALTLLESTATDKLEARFESLKPILLAESGAKADEALNEAAGEGKGQEEGSKGVVVIEEEAATGSAGEADPKAKALSERMQRALRQAGIQLNK